MQLCADGPLAGTVDAEVKRLRELAAGTAGTLILYDLPAARAAGVKAAVLEELATAGREAYVLRVGGERLSVIAGGDRGLLHGFSAVVLGQATSAVDTADAVDGTGGWALRVPAQAIRMLDHWDNMTVHPAMGQAERGYA